ncbi:MAG: GTP 3',8-cyclase MoaA [Candidatus Pelethousia sp.]|nr:GTP 3',8-cyclase MoaA [Candidatus Pelethousia sp.]
MRDGFGRSIDYLRLSVTDRCNLRCQYCMPEAGVFLREHTDILRVEECVAIAEAAVRLGIKKIRITGGEPLVRRGILEICRGIGALSGLNELCLTTNGLLLERYAEDLRKAGVTRLNISLDTLDAKKYRGITRWGELSNALAGIQAAEDAGFANIKINTVLIGGINGDEIPALVELTRDKPYEVRFIELMPLGECANWDPSRFIPAEVVLHACPGLVPCPARGVAERYHIPGYRGTVGLIRPMSHRFCGECNRIRVTADGMLKPCLHSGEEIPLRGLAGDALLAAIENGIEKKPLRHHIEERGSDTERTMNRIGG